ncbi:HAMP domain-containing sensor histidine kinase [Streptomyces sp. NPDC005805]|uniref:sensor histidine kinase n=1 Tax=Streptomyces sp. NPDC005805 TaxID=3157068 RepID=UPI0033D46954
MTGQAAGRSGAGLRPRRGRRPWSLRTRLVVSAVLLIAVVGTVIGAVTTIAFRTYLYGQLDDQLGAVAARAAGPPGPAGQEPPPGGGLRGGPLGFVTGGGAPVGTVGAVVDEDGRVGEAVASTQEEPSGPAPTETRLTAAQRAALASVPRDGRPHTVDLPGRGDHRVEYADGARGVYLVGVPTSDVRDALGTLVLVEVCVTGAGLLAAGIAGASTVGVALRPLRRVAATARRVSELPLHSGEVALHERVPDAEADPRTEVGQVGAALNTLLGHVGSALAARQESETRVRRFVADAGHELRTPLASIRGYAELTRRGADRDATDPVARHALGRIEAEATRMTGLVEDLLLLARLDAGRPVAARATELPSLVVDAVSDARAAGPDHRWRLDLPVAPATVHGDPERLHQVLVNLLANARTHTPPGTTVTARVRTGPDPDPGAGTVGRVVLEVEDDGPGIPAELLPHVFERFARGDASRSRKAGSTGLGLAIVRAVVDAHGGRVAVDSVPGRTVFTVTLPAADPVGQGPVRAGPVAAAGDAAAPAHSPATASAHGRDSRPPEGLPYANRHPPGGPSGP